MTDVVDVGGYFQSSYLNTFIYPRRRFRKNGLAIYLNTPRNIAINFRFRGRLRRAVIRASDRRRMWSSVGPARLGALITNAWEGCQQWKFVGPILPRATHILLPSTTPMNIPAASPFVQTTSLTIYSQAPKFSSVEQRVRVPLFAT